MKFDHLTEAQMGMRMIMTKTSKGTMRHLGNLVCYLIISGFIAHSSLADVRLNNTFLKKLKENGMVFDSPNQDYESIVVRDNDDVSYDLAIRSKRYNMEIRYAIHQVLPGAALLGPLTYFQTVLANIAESDDPFNLPYVEFKKTDVQTEFNADWGASATFAAKPGFAAPFDYCNIVGIQKRNRYPAFMIYLFNRKDIHNISSEMLKIFYVLRYK